jgi:hypothetical protein
MYQFLFKFSNEEKKNVFKKHVCFYVAFGQTFFTFDTNFQMALKNFINILLVSQSERYRAIMALLFFLFVYLALYVLRIELGYNKSA